jgi:transcriptional regulator of acetoin/glycerol metabolism
MAHHPVPPASGIKIVREALRDGAPLPNIGLRPPLRRSWERARAAGMRPGDAALFHHLVSAQEMRQVQNAYRPLIELAAPAMEHLWRSFRSPHWVVLLIDAKGTIVHSLGELEQAPRELRLPLRCGRRLLEGEFGTTAPAIVASEEEAIEVRGEEHFLDELCHFSCAAAPIFNLDGTIAGVLDVTGVNTPMDARALQRVCMAARSIEARMYEQSKDGLLVHLHEDPRFIGTPEQGLMLIGEDGSVLSANRTAREILGLPRNAQHLHLSQVLDEDAVRGLRHVRANATSAADAFLRSEIRSVYARNGAHLFTSVRAHAQSYSRARTSARAHPSEPDPKWLAAFERASRVLPHGVPVLLQGETGTGKEWFARALHEAHRPGKPFVAVNCGALAESLAESELFGYVEGAYTGSRKGGAMGRIEQAHRGTLFLDEIGDMPTHLQTRLLRVLQERSVVRIGGHEEVALDLLVISASHRDLAQMVAEKAFREDLYYRLDGLKVRLPSLRERQDIDLLIDASLRAAMVPGRPAARLPEGLRQRLHNCLWPGNIRQLRHALHVASLLADPGTDITEDMLPEGLLANLEEPPQEQSERPSATAMPQGSEERNSAPPSLDQIRRESISRAISEHSGNVSAAARSLQISRTTLYKHRNR